MLNFWVSTIFTLPLSTRGCGRSTRPLRRYVAYFAAKMERELAYSPVRLLLKAIRLRPPPHVGLQRREAHLQVQVHQTLAPHFDSEVFTVDLTGEEIVFDLPQPLVINGDVKIALCQKFNMDPLKLGSRPTLTSHGPHAKLCHFWVNTCFLALGHSCPLTHTVVDRRGRASSLITIPTTNRFSPLEGALRGCGCDWTDRHGRQGRIGPVPGARGTSRWSWSWRQRVGGGALGGEGQIAGHNVGQGAGVAECQETGVHPDVAELLVGPVGGEGRLRGSSICTRPTRQHLLRPTAADRLGRLQSPLPWPPWPGLSGRGGRSGCSSTAGRMGWTAR